MEFTSETRAILPDDTLRRAVFVGTGGTLFGIYVRNILLTFVTLGIYYFWGKNRTRTYLVNHCEFSGDRFAWHGTGKELFLGMLKLLLLLVPVVGVIIAAQVLWPDSIPQFAVSATVYLVYLLLIPLFVVGSRRYRMSRLSWRGIRFSFRGRFWELFRIYLKGAVLTVITFGLYYPYFQTQIRRFLTRHAYFGSMGFSFDGKGRALIGPYLILVIAAIAAIVVAGVLIYSMATSGERTPPTPRDMGEMIAALSTIFLPLLAAGAVIGLAWVWFSARRHRYFWAHTYFATARFRSTVRTLPLLALDMTNLVFLVVTLGLAWPWVMLRTIRFYFHNLTLEGPLDLAGIVQDAHAAAAATADAAAGIFDLDLLGIDLPF